MLRRLLIFLIVLGGVWLVYRLAVRLGWVPAPARTSEVRLTREGKVFLLFTLLVLLSALHTGVNLIYLTFSVLASALLLSYALASAARLIVRVQRELPVEVTAGETFRARLLLKNRSAWLPAYCVSVQHHWPRGVESDYERHLVLRLPPGRDEALEFPVRATRRGRHPLADFSFGSRFPFGFFELVSRGEGSGELTALPRLGELPEGVLLEEASGAETLRRRRFHSRHAEEFFGLREYRPGDNVSWIHWRTSARHRQLMVREYAAPEQHRFLIALKSVTPPGNERVGVEPGLDPPLERAISFAATLAQELTRRDASVALASYVPRPRFIPYDTGRHHLVRIWRELALLRPAPEGSWEELLRQPGLFGPERCTAVFIGLEEESPEMHEFLPALLPGRGISWRFVSVASPSFGREFVLPPLRDPLVEFGVLALSEP